jgi:hypothetical protein
MAPPRKSPSSPPPPRPRWVKVAVIVVLLLVVVMVVSELAGVQHGPGRHGSSGRTPAVTVA